AATAATAATAAAATTAAAAGVDFVYPFHSNTSTIKDSPNKIIRPFCLATRNQFDRTRCQIIGRYCNQTFRAT
ncbi:MAG TPA: hypothetical protein VGC64_03630, partial [Pyrinomonadaceae bacterium]